MSKKYINSLINIDDSNNRDLYYKFKAYDLQPGAYKITNFINSSTSPEEFDIEVANTPEYKLHFGGRCGWTALECSINKGNEELAIHIARLGKKLVTNKVGAQGKLPITQIGNNSKLAKIFIEEGAILNLATIKYKKIQTPISEAIKLNYFNIAKIFFDNGAILNKNNPLEVEFYNKILSIKLLIIRQIVRQLYTKKIIKREIPEELIDIITRHTMSLIL